MVTTNYCSLDSGSWQDDPKHAGGKQKTASGRMNVFRRTSLTRSESSSIPSVIPIDSNTLSEESRDEVSSLKSDDKNNNVIASITNTPREDLPQREVPPQTDGFHMNDESSFNPFELIPSWGFNDDVQNYAAKVLAQDLVEEPEKLETDKGSKTTTSFESKTNNVNHQNDSHFTKRIILLRPSALKLDQWSKAFVRKKKQFKYHSFSNEKRVSGTKEKQKSKLAEPTFQPIIEDRNDKDQNEYRPENFPSFQSFPEDGLSTFDNGPVANDLFFYPTVGDDKDQCREGTSIGPLMDNTTLKFAIQTCTEGLSLSPVLTERDQPPYDILPLEAASKKERQVAPIKVVKEDAKKSREEGEKVKIKVNLVYETSDCPSDGEHSSVISGDTENLPLLRSWGMKMVDCNNCGSAKYRKKAEAKKKRIEAKKKFLEDLWERKQFYWKYESVKDQQKEQLQQLEQLDALVIKITPETDNMPKNGYIEMPLGIQLSTITEVDEDLTACCSPRSTSRSVSLGAGYLDQDGKVTLHTPVMSLLDSTNKDTIESRSEDEIDGFPQDQIPQVNNDGGAKSKNENSRSSEANAPNSEQQKKVSRSWQRRRVLSVDEIIISPSFDNSSMDDSKGEISDITEDYLHIPFSSPIYSEVLKAFRDAAAKNDGKNETEETNYLHWI